MCQCCQCGACEGGGGQRTEDTGQRVGDEGQRTRESHPLSSVLCPFTLGRDARCPSGSLGALLSGLGALLGAVAGLDS